MNNNGSAIIENVMLIIIVLAALISIYVYVSRSISGSQNRALEDINNSRYEYGSPSVLGRGTVGVSNMVVTRNVFMNATQEKETIEGIGERDVARSTTNIYQDDVTRTSDQTVRY